MSSSIQAVLFDQNLYSPTEARKELAKMNLKPIKPVHKTGNNLRYRIAEPSDFTRMRTKHVKDGITLIIGFYH